MKAAEATKRSTRERAEGLSIFLYGKVTMICSHRIQEGEEDAQMWIRAIEKKYNVDSSFLRNKTTKNQ